MPGLRALAAAAPLALLFLAACDTGGGGGEPDRASASTTTTTAEQPLEVPPPERFRVRPGAFRATLRWDPSPSGPPLDGYEVIRDGRLVTTVRGHETSYVDGDVLPGRRYRWQLVARAGDEAAPPVRATARMRVPPLAEARLEGDFTVRLRNTSHSGYAQLGGPRSLGWKFTPKCSAGSCRRVAWRDLHERGMRGVLVRAGARYTGTYTGDFFASCQGTSTSSYVRVEIEVTKGKALGGGWHATRLTGTLTASESAQLGCVASSRTEAVRARLHESSLPTSVGR